MKKSAFATVGHSSLVPVGRVRRFTANLNLNMEDNVDRDLLSFWISSNFEFFRMVGIDI